MMTPIPPPLTAPPIETPVPTSQRSVNGGISGLAAQFVGNWATGFLLQHGLDPTTSAIIGTGAGSAASAVLATIGDGARGALEKGSPWWAQIPLKLLARIG